MKGNFVSASQAAAIIKDGMTVCLTGMTLVGAAESMFYHEIPLDVVILRGTTADGMGNITMEEEAMAKTSSVNAKD